MRKAEALKELEQDKRIAREQRLSKCMRCDESYIEDDNIKCLYTTKDGKHESYPNKCPQEKEAK